MGLIVCFDYVEYMWVCEWKGGGLWGYFLFKFEYKMGLLDGNGVFEREFDSGR